MTIIDKTKMAPYLAKKLGAEDLSITSVWKNLEGWSMETWSLGLSYVKNGDKVEREIIIRKEPEAGLVEPYDASIEYRVLTAMNKTDVAAPETYWHEPDPSVLGLPFYVMEKVEGDVHFFSTAAIMVSNWRLIPDDDERASLAEEFIKNIALIHNADWRALELDFLGDPGPGIGAAKRQVDFWELVIDRAGFRRKPVVAYALNWLRDNLPETDRVCVVHGDYRTGNYICRDGKIIAVLDWEMVHLGDPMEDISYIIGTAWRSPRPHKWISHLLPKKEFFDKYERASGIKIDDERLKFYHILNNFKAIGIATSAANAFKSKTALDLKSGVFGMTMPVQYFNLVMALNKYLPGGAK